MSQALRLPRRRQLLPEPLKFDSATKAANDSESAELRPHVQPPTDSFNFEPNRRNATFPFTDEIASNETAPDDKIRQRDRSKLIRKQEKVKRGDLKRFDQPDEAVKYYLQQRLPAGEKELPMERYFEAREKMRFMDQYSIAEGKVLPPEGKRDESSIGAPQAPNFTWSNLGPGNVGGRTRALVIDPTAPNTMYSGGVDGGVWKTTNGGTTWTPQDDFMANIAITAIAMHPTNTQILYAATGEGFFNADAVRGAGIFQTTNGGATWTRLASTNNSNFHFVNDVVISPADPTHLYAATRTGVHRSLDSGATWTLVLASNAANGNNGAMDLVIRNDQPTDYVIAAVGTFAQSHIFRNTDAGGAGVWTDVNTEANMGRTSLAIAPSNQATIYALAAHRTSHDMLKVARSTDGGATWTNQVTSASAVTLNRRLLTNPVFSYAACVGASVGNFNQGWYDNVIAVDPVDPNIVWSGGIDLFRSNDGGANWGQASHWWFNRGVAPEYAHADHHVIVFHPGYNGTSNKIMFNASDGGLFKTIDARAPVSFSPDPVIATSPVCGNTAAGVMAWTELNNGYQVSQFYHGLPYPNGTTYFGGFQDNGTNRGTDAGGPNAWTQLTGGDGGYVAINDLADANPANDILFSEFTGLSIQRSLNGGVTFAPATTGITESGGNFQFINPFIMDRGNLTRLWTGGFFMWRTTNSAATWTGASAITCGNGNVTAIAVAPTDGNRVASGMSDGCINRTSIGLTSTAATVWGVSTPRAGNVSWLEFDPTNANVLYATYSTFGGTHVWKSLDSGATWAALDGTGLNTIPDIPVHNITVDPLNPTRLFVGTDLGIFVSVDGGVNWLKESTFPNVATESMTVNTISGQSSLFAFTHGRSAFKTSVAPSPSIIINELDSAQAGADTMEFIEIYDGGAGNTSLTGLVLVLYDGGSATITTDAVSYGAFDLDGFTTNANGYFIVGSGRRFGRRFGDSCGHFAERR